MIWSSCLEPVPPIFILFGPAGLDRVDVLLGGLVRRVGVDPEHELVERHHRHRRHVLPVEGHAGRHRRREQVRQRDDDLVRVALGVLDVEEALGARAARLVDDDHRLLHQLVLDDDALDQARHLVGAAAGARGHDELDRLGRLPGREGGAGARAEGGKDNGGGEAASADRMPARGGLKLMSCLLANGARWAGASVALERVGCLRRQKSSTASVFGHLPTIRSAPRPSG